MVIILIGPPGCGKGTQGAKLESHLGMPYLVLGNLVRTKLLMDPVHGEYYRNIVNNGGLIEDSVMDKLFVDNVSSNLESGCILDGYPRKLEQAKFLDTLVDPVRTKVFHFNISQEVLVRRVEGRFACASCGKIYNKYWQDTQVHGICDACGGEQFVTRKDDNIDVFLHRMNNYNNETFPVVEHYRNVGVVEEIEAEQSVDDIFNQILSKLDYA